MRNQKYPTKNQELAKEVNENPEQDLMQYAPLVKRIAYQIFSKLPANVELDDLIQVGLIGLIEAARQFDPAQNVLFETFAAQRVRGAMLDELRRIDWLPRQIRQNAKQIETALSTLETQLGRWPQDSEVADFLSLDLESYQKLLFECKGHMLVYLEDFTSPHSDDRDVSFADTIEDQHTPTPDAVLNDKNFRAALVKAIQALPERYQVVMSLYYEQELNLREIGEILDISESRVCQLHTHAVSRLRARLAAWL